MRRTVYERNYVKLEGILGGNLKEVFEKYGYLKLKANGYMDLSVDVLSDNTLSLAHNYELNGDIVPDPDMEIEVNFDLRTVEALTMQNIFGYVEVYTYTDDGKKKGIYPERKKELNEFLSLWLKNLKEQKHSIAETRGK